MPARIAHEEIDNLLPIYRQDRTITQTGQGFLYFMFCR